MYALYIYVYGDGPRGARPTRRRLCPGVAPHSIYLYLYLYVGLSLSISVYIYIYIYICIYMDTCLYVDEGMKRALRRRLRDGPRGARPAGRRFCPGWDPTPFALDHSS